MSDLPEDVDVGALDVECVRCGAAIGEPCKRRAPYTGIAHCVRAWRSDDMAARARRPLDIQIARDMGRDTRSWYAKAMDQQAAAARKERG